MHMCYIRMITDTNIIRKCNAQTALIRMESKYCTWEIR